MRKSSLVKGDIGFQLKYGFYLLYLVLSVFYIAILFALPSAWREKAALLMIFTDPAAMGLYFMGAIVLLEKSQRVLNSIAVSPVTPLEYVLSKLISISIISTAVGLLIGTVGGVISNGFYFTAGVFLGSCLFSAVGLMIAANITTLNAFMIATIPASIMVSIPAIAYLFDYQRNWMVFHPGVGIIALCSNAENAKAFLIVLLLWTLVSVLAAYGAISRMLLRVGGVKL